MSSLWCNYKEIRDRIDAACVSCGRDPKEVTLIAVSKTKPVEMVEELAAHGVTEFGENKVQEIVAKNEVISSVNWHMIGHLQRNKVKQVVGKACMIHSVDSMRLAQEIEKEAAKADIIVPILLEINIGSEDSKDGIPITEAECLAKEIAALPHIKPSGLMCVAPYTETPEELRPLFRSMKETCLKLRSLNLPGSDYRELSMGMTNDFEVAVSEGATFVRVGTAIFGARVYPGV